jgi:hypothetical protein
MTLSTVIKNKLLEVTHLQYRLLVEIKNEDDAWIDFCDRDPRVPSIRMSTEKRRNQIVSSVGSVTLTNDDNYFDWMDNPANATTISTFGALATKFAKGFRGKQVRISLRVTLPDNTYEDAGFGTYRVKTVNIDPSSGRATLNLCQDVDFLKGAGTESLTDGKKHYENKPITYLVREILKRFYTAGVTSSDFEIPGRIYRTTADGNPAFSSWGKPPERDATGRWRSDVEHKPTTLHWESTVSKFYVGVGDEVWSFDPLTEIWVLCGTFADDDFQVRGIYPISTLRLLVVGYKHEHSSRAVTLRTAQLLLSSDSMTTNDPGNDSLIFPGEFVLRDTYTTAGSPLGIEALNVGLMRNAPGGADANNCYGALMAVPFPQYPHSGCPGAAGSRHMGFSEDTAEVHSGDWTTFTHDADAHGIEVLNPCWVACAHQGVGSATNRPELLVSWGMKPNLAWAGSLANFTGPYLFAVETDGNPMGIRCIGVVRIIAYSAYSGTHHYVSEHAQGGALAPMYDLRFYTDGSDDFIYWIDVDFVEQFINVDYDPLDLAPPLFHIKRGKLTDDGLGKPELLDSNRETLWTGGDDLFAADDNHYAPISCMPYPNGDTEVPGFIIQMLDIEAVGGACFKLFYVNAAFTSKTLLASSYYGWGAFTQDATNNKIYFLDRDTGCVCYVDISSAPTVYYRLSDGEEPVSKASFELPQAEGMVIRTENSKVCLYGISHPYLPGWVNQNLIYTQGKYNLWKWHPELTDRIDFFEAGREDAWDAMGLLAEVCDYQVGMDPEGTGFFRAIPDGSAAEEFTIDLDSPIGRYITCKKLDGLDEIVNRSTFVPYEAVSGEPEVTLDLVGALYEGEQVYFNGDTYSKTETNEEQNITLHCIKRGTIGVAKFRYLVHDSQVSTNLREAVSLAAHHQLRLDNNADLAVGMFVQVGDWDEGAKITTIEADGDIIIDLAMTTAFAVGTPVIVRSAEHGKWSTEYTVPDEYTALATYAEIGTTGVFLKFELSDEGVQYGFEVGDRIRAYNPGMNLERSRTKKTMAEDSSSIVCFNLSEENPDNPYMSLGLGREKSKSMVASYAWPRHGWELATPMFLQAKPLTIVKLKSRKHLPTATSNEEKCYIKQVSHDHAGNKSTITLKACVSYRTT